jgi:hypothetical protein
MMCEAERRASAILAVAILLAGAASALPPGDAAGGQPRYDEWFTDGAMRVDLVHSGTSDEWSYSLDDVVREPVWPGTRRYLVDPFGYGTHRMRVTDAQSGKEIFSIGYATLFDEWTGTDEALAGVRRAMSESVRMPWPRKPVVLHIDRRGKDGSFAEIFALGLDPSSHLTSAARPFAGFEVLELGGTRPPDRAMDVVIVPEGYSSADLPKLRADMERFAGAFLEAEPWRSNRESIHLRGVLALSRESGVSEPRKGIFRDTILGASFNTFDSPRYLTVTQTKTLRQVASLAPYDVIYVMVNTGRYGGGGVYNQWSVFVSDNEYDDYVMLHEFGHHMGGLADEYYSSAVSTDEDLMYPPGYEPWEPNITAFVDGRRESIKWNDLIADGMPVPTPEQAQYAGKVGLFEGAGYKAKGLYRAEMDCKMFHKGRVGFCAVCRRSLEAMLRYYSGEDMP